MKHIEELYWRNTYQYRLSPSSSNGVDIRPANATVFDLDVNIVVARLLWLEIDQLQLIPVFSIVNTIGNISWYSVKCLYDFRGTYA